MKTPTLSWYVNWRKSLRCWEVCGTQGSFSSLLTILVVIIARVAGSSSTEDTYDPQIPPEKQKVTYKTKDGQLKTVTKAELQEQLETSEKLMQSLNETWEEKLVKTQEVQKEREKALEELGITVEKNLVGVHTPKRVSIHICFAHVVLIHISWYQMPHLVNLVSILLPLPQRWDLIHVLL